MKQPLSAILLLPIVAVAQQARNLSLAAIRRLNSAWGRLTKLRKAIVVGIGVIVVMVSSSILNQGKPDAASNNFLTMIYTMLVLLMWGLYRLIRRSRILVAVALSVALNGLGALAALDHDPPRWVLFFIAPSGFLTWLFGRISGDFGAWLGFWLGLLLSIALYAVVAWTILVALASLKKWSRSKSSLTGTTTGFGVKSGRSW